MRRVDLELEPVPEQAAPEQLQAEELEAAQAREKESVQEAARDRAAVRAAMLAPGRVPDRKLTRADREEQDREPGPADFRVQDRVQVRELAAAR